MRVGNLASRALSLAVRRLADDWKAHHGYHPVLVETFVDLSRFSGACYRAANWRFVGETKGKGSVRTPKGVFVHPLDKDFRAILMNGRPLPPKRSAAPTGAAVPVVGVWRSLIDAVVAVAHDFDRSWQKRQRSLNTLLVVLFIFRLVLSKNRQGYGATLAELWDPVPPAGRVAAAALPGVGLGDVQRPGQGGRESVPGLARRAPPARRRDRHGGLAGRGIGYSRWTARS